MAFVPLTNTNRALAYGESELGEVAILNEAAQTYTILDAKSGTVKLAAGQSVATITTRVAVIHKAIANVNG